MPCLSQPPTIPFGACDRCSDHTHVAQRDASGCLAASCGSLALLVTPVSSHALGQYTLVPHDLREHCAVQRQLVFGPACMRGHCADRLLSRDGLR